MANAPVWLTEWLGKVFDGAGIHDRKGWSMALGVTEQRLFEWTGGTLPTARAIHSVLILLEERYPEKGKALLVEWKLNASKRMTADKRFEDWALEPLWEDLRLAAAVLPTAERKKILFEFLGKINETRLKVSGKEVQA